MLFNVNVLDTNLDYVACLEHLGGMLDKLIAHLGDMKQTVVVNTDINEATEVNNVSYSTLKLHIGLKVVDVENVGGKNRSGRIVTDIAAGLLKLGDNIEKSGLATAKLASELLDAVLLCLEAKERKISASYVLNAEAESLK